MTSDQPTPDHPAEVMVPDSEVTELCAWHRARERDRLIASIRERWQESESVPVSSVINLIEATRQ